MKTIYSGNYQDVHGADTSAVFIDCTGLPPPMGRGSGLNKNIQQESTGPVLDDLLASALQIKGDVGFWGGAGLQRSVVAAEFLKAVLDEGVPASAEHAVTVRHLSLNKLLDLRLHA